MERQKIYKWETLKQMTLNDRKLQTSIMLLKIKQKQHFKFIVSKFLSINDQKSKFFDMKARCEQNFTPFLHIIALLYSINSLSFTIKL